MPLYCLKCPGCGARFDLLAGLDQADDAKRCPDCSIPLETDWPRQGAPGATRNRSWYGRERRSVSLGVNPEQIRENQRRCPSWKFDDRTGDALFESDEHMRRCLRELDRVGREETEREKERQAAEAHSSAPDEGVPYHTDLGNVPKSLVGKPLATAADPV